MPLFEKPAQWCDESLDDPPVYEEIEVVLKKEEMDGGQKTRVFFYYIGCCSKETPFWEPLFRYRRYPDNALIIRSIANAYHLPVYPGEQA